MKVQIQTLGCKVNFAEMADLSDRLARAGFEVAEEHAHPDICVINTCTVTAQADRKVRTLVHGLRRRHPRAHLVLTGCHVDNPNPRVSAVPSVDVAFPNARKHEILGYLLASFQPTRGTSCVSLPLSQQSPSPLAGEGQGGGFHESPSPLRGGTREGIPAFSGSLPLAGRDREGVPAIGRNAFARSRYFLKVQDGCNHRCTYCIVWRTRGASRSEATEELLSRADRAVAGGFRELVLTGVDLGAYGRERGESLAAFVSRLLDGIGPARLRLSSINANDFTPELIELVAHPRFCRHFHIPLQSGSDHILKRMGRLYRRRQYLDLVAELRERIPDLALTTDIIVGFPGETETDFAETRAVAQEAGFSGMHVFRYSPRAGTAAPRLGLPVNDPVSRERSRLLQEQAETQRRSYEARFLGKDLEVIWDRRFPGRVRGLSDNYITVWAPGSEHVLGDLALARPHATCPDGLLADLPVH